MKHAWVGVVLAAMLLAGCTSEATPRPLVVRFLPGADDAAAGAFLPTLLVAQDGASFTLGVRGVAGASLHIPELLLVENMDAVAHEFSLANVDGAASSLDERLDLFDAQGARVGTLDLARPSSVGTDLVLSPHEVLRVSLTLTAPEDAAGASASQRVAATTH